MLVGDQDEQEGDSLLLGEGVEPDHRAGAAVGIGGAAVRGEMAVGELDDGPVAGSEAHADAFADSHVEFGEAEPEVGFLFNERVDGLLEGFHAAFKGGEAMKQRWGCGLSGDFRRSQVVFGGARRGAGGEGEAAGITEGKAGDHGEEDDCDDRFLSAGDGEVRHGRARN